MYLLLLALDSDIIHYRPAPDPFESPIFVVLWMLLIFGPAIYWTLRYLYKRRYYKYWNKGIFPPQLEMSRDSVLEAYICLAARMMQRDITDLPGKVSFIHKYFAKYFPGETYKIRESISFSLKNPIQLDTVIHWIKLNLPKKKSHLQIMYFLSGLAMVDGVMLPGEERLLKEIGDLLELTPGEMQSILAMHRRYEEERRKNEQKRTTRPTKTEVELCAEILGISVHAGIEEIKKSYRKLVKLHHPDRFASEGNQQQAIAQDRFIQIQKAYEILMASK